MNYSINDIIPHSLITCILQYIPKAGRLTILTVCKVWNRLGIDIFLREYMEELISEIKKKEQQQQQQQQESNENTYETYLNALQKVWGMYQKYELNWRQYDVARLLCYIAVSQRHRGKSEESVITLQSALKISPDCIMALNNLGETLIILDQYEESLPYFDKLLQLVPNSIYGLYNKGRALMYLCKFKEAEACLVQAHDLNEKDKGQEPDKDVEIELIWARLHCGHFEQALSLCKNERYAADPLLGYLMNIIHGQMTKLHKCDCQRFQTCGQTVATTTEERNIISEVD